MPRCGAEFRSRLVAHQASERLLDVLVAQLHEQGWIKARGKQVPARDLNRLDAVSLTGDVG